MKSESTKMMLRHICFISCFLLISYGQTAELQPDEFKELSDNNQNTSTSVKMSVTSHTNSEKLNLDNFESSHKIHEDLEFQTAHKINKDHQQPLSKILEARTSESLMQMQQTQNLLATKERPELNPVLSALINEDVMKSIEAKRAIENEHHLTSPITATTENPVEESGTLDNVPILTTEPIPTKKSHSSHHEESHAGLIDQSITLEEAGSENSPKSRIQVKKGPKGEDYEYEYVYYYYDDDEKNENEKEGSASDTKEKNSSNSDVTPRPKEATSRGKSRYTNIERSTTSVPENEIVSKAKGRSSIPVTEDVDEGRLPANTRFPPRSKNSDVTPTPSMDNESNEKTEKSERNRKIGVKRPSLELVDSETFNTDEKQAKGNRNLDTESTKTAQQTEAENEVKSSDKASSKSANEVEESNSTDDTDEIENTTPLMEKVAFDLYAILANENLNLDMTTDGTEDMMTTDIPDTTDAEDLTTISSELEASSTTTTTTTPEPTTTTTTTTTTPAPLPSSRRGLGSVGRNRFRLKSGASASTPASTTESTSSASEATTKGKNRFQRPSFGGRTPKPSSTSAPAKEETVEKEEAKPVSSSPVRGRTRNRFNLRGSSTTTEKSIDDANSAEDQVSSTTARTLRARPTLNIRGRGRPSSTTTTANPEINDNGNSEEKTEEKSSSLLPTRPSRFNLNRPGSAAGGNKLLPRGRINPLRTTAAPSVAETESEDEDKKEVDAKEHEASGETVGENGDDKTSESTTQAAGGLNRLRNRPRIQINTKTDKPKPQPLAVNRKVNPLLARRKLGLGSSTTEASTGEDENEEQEPEKEDKKEDAAEIKDEEKEETTEAVEVSSEPPRGLGLLGNRRRLPLRKPGTIL